MYNLCTVFDNKMNINNNINNNMNVDNNNMNVENNVMNVDNNNMNVDDNNMNVDNNNMNVENNDMNINNNVMNVDNNVNINNKYHYICTCKINTSSLSEYIYKDIETNFYFISSTEPNIKHEMDSSFRYFITLPYHTHKINIIRQLTSEEINYLLIMK